MRTPTLALLIAIAACAPRAGVDDAAPHTARETAPASVDSVAVAAEVTAMLTESSRAWNRDDLDAFIADYATDRPLSFVGGETVVRSVETLRTNYERSWFGGVTVPPDLDFSEVEVRPLGASHALAFGRWTLYTPGFEEQPVVGSGWFSLVLERIDGRWKIIHDHSS